MGVHQFTFQIKDINRLIDYIPGEGGWLSEEKELIKILWFVMMPWYQAMAVQARFDYLSEKFQSILSYFS